MNDVEILRTGGAGGKRVAAPRPLPPPPSSPPPPGSPCWLRAQECGSAAASSSQDLQAASFSHFQLQRELDLFRLTGQQAVWPPVYLRRRSPVREVIAAEGLVLALAESGVCTAYEQETGAPLCYLNVQADELICSLFVCPTSRSLLTVSTFTGDAHQRLRVRATPLAAIARGQLRWRHLFDSEVLCFPGFIEFDDVNNVVLTRSADSAAFKLWDLRGPQQPRFSLSAEGVREVKVAAAGALLLVMEPQHGAATQQAAQQQQAGQDAAAAGWLLVRVLDLQDGSLVQEVRVPLPANAAAATADGGGGGGLELVELFGGCLLTKAGSGPLQIRDLAAGSLREVPAGAFAAPAAFLYTQFNHSFLAFFENADAQLWSLPGGQRLATLAGARLPSSCNGIYVSEDQRRMFVYCAPPEVASSGSGGSGSGSSGEGGATAAAAATAGGSVRVFDLLRGRQVAAVQAPPPPPPLPPDRPGCSTGAAAATPEARRAAAAATALRHVSALYYDQPTHRLYTGTADGRVQAWGL